MGIRTPDLLIANETLYQLSYIPQILYFKLQPSHFKHPTHPFMNLELQVIIQKESASLPRESASRGGFSPLPPFITFPTFALERASRKRGA